jgi:CRP/FNR family cyclic AMP-dependent transcriptional regulator
MEPSALSEEVREAWSRSPLAQLPPEVAETLVTDARAELLAPGDHWSPELARLQLVVRGLCRVYLSSPDGRQATIRYARRGDVLGLAGALDSSAPSVPAPSPEWGEALAETLVLRLPWRAFREACSADARVAWLAAEEIGRRLRELQPVVAEHAFASVRQRVARHLLALAESGDDAPVVRASQLQIAEAVGSVREVVTRAIGALQAEGLLARGARGLVVLDARALAEVALFTQGAR